MNKLTQCVKCHKYVVLFALYTDPLCWFYIKINYHQLNHSNKVYLLLIFLFWQNEFLLRIISLSLVMRGSDDIKYFVFACTSFASSSE